MRTIIVKRTAAAAIAAALAATLVPAPAVAEVAKASGRADDGTSMAIEYVREMPEDAMVADGTDAHVPEVPAATEGAAEAGKPAQAEELTQVEELTQAEVSPQAEEGVDGMAACEQSFQPIVLSLQANGTSPNAWTADDTRLVADLVSTGNTMSDMAKIFLNGGSMGNVLNGSRGLITAALKWTAMGGEPGTTMYDIMDKLQAINNKLGGMEATIDNVALGVNLVNTRDLLESLADLSVSCSEVEEMFDADHLTKLGIEPLPANATDEQANAWRENTVKAMLEASKKRDPAGFIQYEADMDHIKQLYTHVSNAVAESSATNPITAWDSYWANYYNWETEGWGARQALRTSAASTLVRAYSLLAVYLQMYKNPEHTETALTRQLQNALAQIGSMNAGQDPESVRNALLAGKKVHVWSPTLKKFATSVNVSSGIDIDSQKHSVPDSDIDAYVRRLHGMNVEDDLKLAGIAQVGSAWNGTVIVGLCYRGGGNNGTYNMRILYWDGHYGTEKTRWTDVHHNTIDGHECVWLNLTEN